MYEREIVYAQETRDFEMRLNGELVGFARTYQEAEQTLDELVYELLNRQFFRELSARSADCAIRPSGEPATAVAEE